MIGDISNMKHDISDKVNKKITSRSHSGSASSSGVSSDAGATLSDKAYAAILEAVFSRQIPAGAVVSQNELVKMLGIPVQPMRDALRVLQAEGVVTIHARSGIEFLKPDLELARSTYQFRSIIECAGVRCFAESGSSELVDQLIESHKQVIAALESDGINEETLARIDDLERRFHGAIVGALRNPLIEVVAGRLKNYMSLIRLERHFTVPVSVRTINEHLAVLKACAEHDADKAEEGLVAHFRLALNRTIGMI